MQRWWQARWVELHDYLFPHTRNNWRPHFFSAASLVALVLVVVILEGAYFADTRLLYLRTNFLASVLPATLLDLTNQDRVANNAPALTENAQLDEAAKLAAQDMAAKSYFAHVSPSGTTPWDWLSKVGYAYSYAGENLAVNFTDSDAVERAWMDSPTHRANIVKPQYTQIGFGTAVGEYEGQQTTFVVTFFGAPLAVAEPIATPAPQPALPRVASSAPLALATSVPLVLGAAAPAPSLIEEIAASPASTAEAAIAILFALIAVVLLIAIFTKIKIQHASVIAGGAFLLALSAGALALDQSFIGAVRVPLDTQNASAISALAR